MDEDNKLAAIKSVLEEPSSSSSNESISSEAAAMNTISPETDNSYEQAREYQTAAVSNTYESSVHGSDSSDNDQRSSSNPEDNIKSIDDLIKALEEEKKKL